MDVKCLETRKINGVEIVQFVPTPGMRLFAMSAYCDPALSGKDPEEICSSIGLGKSSYKNFLKFEPYFSEWMEEMRLAMGGKNKKNLLEAVGMEHALKGNFSFWKPLAIREGVISEDKLTIGAEIPSNLGAFKGMTDEQLAATENSVMDALRAQGQPREIDMVEGAGGWEPKGDPGGTPEVPRSVVLADELGVDGERALEGFDSF